jgi:type IV secretory pathway VirB2 component (pilin)
MVHVAQFSRASLRWLLTVTIVASCAVAPAAAADPEQVAWRIADLLMGPLGMAVVLATGCVAIYRFLFGDHNGTGLLVTWGVGAMLFFGLNTSSAISGDHHGADAPCRAQSDQQAADGLPGRAPDVGWDLPGVLGVDVCDAIVPDLAAGGGGLYLAARRIPAREPQWMVIQLKALGRQKRFDAGAGKHRRFDVEIR